MKTYTINEVIEILNQPGNTNLVFQSLSNPLYSIVSDEDGIYGKFEDELNVIPPGPFDEEDDDDEYIMTIA